MAEIPTSVSESTRRRNPHLYGGPMATPAVPASKTKAQRLRQDTGPKMNKLEARFYQRLLATYPLNGQVKIHIQTVTLKLANGLRYTPDFFTFNDFFNKVIAWETKGKWVDGDSFPKLKMAASVYPEIEFRLAWEDGGQWKEQKILS